VKILLDECLPLDFRRSFPHHETHTAERAGLKGRKNGELLRSAEAAGYSVLLTVDQGIPHQQPSAGRLISIILIRARTNQLEHLLPLVEIAVDLQSRDRKGAVTKSPGRPTSDNSTRLTEAKS
jgi:predicted nuclease of predicted toxin-antitoxin system